MVFFQVWPGVSRMMKLWLSANKEGGYSLMTGPVPCSPVQQGQSIGAVE